MHKKVTCTNHCSQCRRCFHSLAAFDRHLIHDEDHWPRCRDPLVDEECQDSAGNSVFTALTRDGVCHARERREGVTVWTLCKGLRGATERFEALGWRGAGKG